MATTLVIADDERDILELTAARLAKQGYVVLLADNGEDALALVRQHTPNLVLLDCEMPQVDGLEVCRRVKADPRLRHIPVLIFSAGADRMTPEVLHAAQADDCIKKPFEGAELLEKIKRLLAHPQ